MSAVLPDSTDRPIRGGAGLKANHLRQLRSERKALQNDSPLPFTKRLSRCVRDTCKFS